MSNIKVLFVEDELVLASVVKETLDKRGFELTLATNGVEGWSAFNNRNPDVCVIDVMMPRKDGFSLAIDIRKVNQTIPIIFLTAKNDTADVIKGFEAGGDDYMKKPFSMEELIVRLKNLNRRNNPDPIVPNQDVKLGDFKFDHQRLELEYKGNAISLSQREADLLKLLAEHKNNLLERKKALLVIWGDDTLFNARNMDVYITRLRKYLVCDPSLQILNVRGFGYKLID